MALQLILGQSGSGKSYYTYNKIIKESIDNPKTNYILLVPEQYSMALQRKMVMLHPTGGTLNIDVIGFNRLAYRIFDELLIKPANVLEDFGKTMLLRQVAGSIKERLKIYGGCLDKNGFIDEAKSLMSELYQYDIDRQRLKEVLAEMKSAGDSLLTDKLSDMLAIFEAFDERIASEYIAAEQLTELLAKEIKRSKLIKNSVIIFDGFTGFTPIQLNVIRELLRYARDIYAVITIDEASANKGRVAEHELFYLSRQTIDSLRSIAKEENADIRRDIFINEHGRWRSGHEDLVHLENNIFRFPSRAYDDIPENVRLSVYNNPRSEIIATAEKIYRLVHNEGYRYKDIALISGNLEGVEGHVKNIFTRYDIPFFIDETIPVKNNAYIDAIGHVLRIVNEDFSYDSVFSFLKSQILEDVSLDDIEELENYVLARGVRGRSYWERQWKCEADDSRKQIMEVLSPFAKRLGKRKHKVSEFITALREFMENINYEKGMELMPRVYDSLCMVLDKMENIMADEVMRVEEFKEILDVGLKDINLGRIPSSLDEVLVGDITRTRLEDVRVLFVLGANDGIIPKKGASSQIINDLEKDTLADLGIQLAPTERTNSFIEQFYLYINMTKPSEKLFISYTMLSDSGENMRPSYIVSRLEKVFPKIAAQINDEDMSISSMRGSLGTLIEGMRNILEGDTSRINETVSLYKLYMDMGDSELIKRVELAFNYNNIPKKLSDEVGKLIRIKCMSQSVSRLEKFAGCAYSYFLRYILELRERSTNIIDNRGVGNVLHEVMENLYRHVKDNLSNDWSMLSEEERDRLVNMYTYQVFERDHDDEGRNEYLKETLARIGRRTAKVMSEITKSDLFVPEYFEYSFREKLPVLDKGFTLTLNGIVDRGDVFYSESDNTLKLRIIDYKSGNHVFDVTKLYDGLQLQLSVYMHFMKKLVAECEAKANRHAELVPDGMYYYQMQDPYVNAEDDESAEKERAKNLKLKGIDYSEPEKFDAAVDYSIKKAADIVNKILDGDISKNPMVKESGIVCNYCEFKAVCRFDDRCGGNSYRYPSFTSKDTEKAFARIIEELGGK